MITSIVHVCKDDSNLFRSRIERELESELCWDWNVCSYMYVVASQRYSRISWLSVVIRRVLTKTGISQFTIVTVSTVRQGPQLPGKFESPGVKLSYRGFTLTTWRLLRQARQLCPWASIPLNQWCISPIPPYFHTIYKFPPYLRSI